MARIEGLIESELSGGDEVIRAAVLHLFRAGGKRFRPLFTVLSAQLGPDPDNWQVAVAGAAIELVHLATLYHDDVMDDAQVRRAHRVPTRGEATTLPSSLVTTCSPRLYAWGRGWGRTRYGSSPTRSHNW